MKFKTESINNNTNELDSFSSLAFVQIFLEEDKAVWQALNQAQEQIARVIDIVSENILKSDDYLETYNPKDPKPYNGPKVFYLGAGTSGRLGVLDAAECVPTFSSHPDMFQGIIAGGEQAMFKAIEGAEDNEKAGAEIIKEKLKAKDIVIGISASGSAPYVKAALQAAQELNLLSIAIANNPDAQIFSCAKHNILLDTGAEILTGSTRLKAATAQKIVLNMISTGVMLRLGKTYKNLMVDLQATNSKLITRAIRLTIEITGASDKEAQEALQTTNYRVKHAALKILKNLNYQEAEALLNKHKGFLKACIDS